MFSIRPMTPDDWPAVRAIYLEGIATRLATFETEAPDWAEWDREHLAAGRLVADGEGTVGGWAALSAVSGRCVYGGVAEVSVYVAEAYAGRGIGNALMEALITPPRRPASGASRPGSSPKIRPVSPCIRNTVSAMSASGSVSAAWMVCGVTLPCWSGAAAASASTTARGLASHRPAVASAWCDTIFGGGSPARRSG